MPPIHKYVIILFFIIAPGNILAQTDGEKVLFDLNRSRHGTGDMGGLAIHLQYSNRLSKKLLDWYNELGFTINDLVYFDRNPNIGNESYVYEQRYVTAGLQIGGGISFKPLSTKHEIAVQLGPVARYQSSSYPVITSTYYPEFTKLPFVVERVEHRGEPLRTLTLGGKLRLGYSYTFRKGFLMGANVNFQTDTNGDTMYGYGLTLGKRL